MLIRCMSHWLNAQALNWHEVQTASRKVVEAEAAAAERAGRKGDQVEIEAGIGIAITLARKARRRAADVFAPFVVVLDDQKGAHAVALPCATDGITVVPIAMVRARAAWNADMCYSRESAPVDRESRRIMGGRSRRKNARHDPATIAPRAA
jgi:hypothetical protein